MASTKKKKPRLVLAKLDENSTDEELNAFIEALTGKTEEASEDVEDEPEDDDD